MPALPFVLFNRWSLLALLIGLAFIVNEGLQAEKLVQGKAPHEIYHGIVRSVVDGDSLYLAGLDTQIRLWGVDAPEHNEAGFATARTVLRSLALNHHLSCITVDIDRYKRIVARCAVTKPDSTELLVEAGGSFSFAASALELNKQMLASGAAQEYCYFSGGYYGYCQ